MQARPELLVDTQCETGEGPLWHPEEKRLYWVDIPKGILYRYTPETGVIDTFQHHETIGGITLQQDGTLLLFMARGAVSIWCEDQLATVLEGLPGENDNRFNDVIADPEGRVFCGTMTTPSHAGCLYRVDRNRQVQQLLDGVGTANGMGFSPDLRHFYFTDTRAHRIDLFDYDRGTGAITNRRPFTKADDGRGRPDGMTVDAEGCVWSARWDGYGLIRYDPNGREIAWYELPARNVTSLTFGGPDYTDIYITSAIGKDSLDCGTHAGAVFHMNPGIPGAPEFRSAL